MKENKNSEIEALTIKIEDHYGDQCLNDGFSKPRRSRSEHRPAGHVEIYDETGKIIGKSNLVVYTGREVITAKMFNVQNPNIEATPDEYICWFGVGSGGCPIGDPLNPFSPSNTDEDLNNPVGINASDGSCADFRDGFYFKHPIDDVEYESDPENNDAYLIAKVTISLSIYDANGNNINEVALYTASENTGGYNGNFTLYAKTTFPTVVKTSSRQLTFIWYLFY